MVRRMQEIAMECSWGDNSPRQLIINADDFGFTKSISEGILQAIRHGIVTSTSVMANMPAALDTVGYLRAMGCRSIGIHLNLTSGISIRSHRTSIAGTDGRFFGVEGVWWRGVTRRLPVVEIKAELEAQIETLTNQGIEISHIDGHHHIHILPQLVPIVCALAKKYDIRAVRCPYTTGYGLVGRARLKWRLINHFALQSRPVFLVSGLAMPNHFAAWYAQGDETLNHLKRTLTSIGSGVTEIGVHPGYVDEALVGIDSYRNERHFELQALCDPSLSEFLSERGIRMTNFGSLAGSPKGPAEVGPDSLRTG